MLIISKRIIFAVTKLWQMESLKELDKIGNGPSTRHTIGPRKAAIELSEKNPGADAYRVTLYGSLAATGKGHLTDRAILDVLEPLAPTEIVWEPSVFLPFHPNGMKYEALKDGKVTDEWLIFSVGGGALANEDTPVEPGRQVYDLNTIADIQAWCEANGTTYWEYAEKCEGRQLWDYLRIVWQTMRETIEKGLENEGTLPGGLGVRRKASTYYVKAQGHTDSMRNRGLRYASALATSEQTAAGGLIVTAPTCGSRGGRPASWYHTVKARTFL